MEKSIPSRVKEFIARNGLLEDRAKVVVGLSGGADSTALLLILHRLGYSIHAVHCNFHLRGQESDRDQAFAEELCHKLGVELTVCHYDTRQYATSHGISIEMAARELRYADFERIMTECSASAICIAHHRDDSVETVLLNLIRGTGIKGLTGIKPRNGHIIRPLLCISRAEIEKWLNETGQTYVTDSTNLETDYTRNKIRLSLLPMMRDINPAADEAIISTASHVNQAYNLYKYAVDELKASIVSQNEDIISIDINTLRHAPSVQGFLFEILTPYGFNDAQICSISASLDSQPGIRFLSTTHQLVKDRGSFIVSPICSSEPSIITISPTHGTSVALPDGRTLHISTAPAGTPISASPLVATFDASLIKEDITIRQWQDGDWFIPFGMKGRKLVSDYLTDCKVNALEKKNQLVATCGDSIIWILGYRTDNRFRVTPQTSGQLILTLSKA